MTPQQPRSKFAEMLRARRRKLGWPQKRMAHELGISPSYLCDLESGRRLPSVGIVQSICWGAGCGEAGRRRWHLAGARAHGWDVGAVADDDGPDAVAYRLYEKWAGRGR